MSRRYHCWLQVAEPRIALATGGPHFDHASLLNPNSVRHVARDDVDRPTISGRAPLHVRYPSVRTRNAIHNIEETIIHSASVKQAVVFGRPSVWSQSRPGVRGC